MTIQSFDKINFVIINNFCIDQFHTTQYSTTIITLIKHHCWVLLKNIQMHMNVYCFWFTYQN